MLNLRLIWLCFGVAILVSGCAHRSGAPLAAQVNTTPKLEILNQQIKNNPNDAQAFSNRGYTLALLGKATEARADLQKALELKANGPMHNRVGWAYFNLGDYGTAAKEFEVAAKLSNNRSH